MGRDPRRRLGSCVAWSALIVHWYTSRASLRTDTEVDLLARLVGLESLGDTCGRLHVSASALPSSLHRTHRESGPEVYQSIQRTAVDANFSTSTPPAAPDRASPSRNIRPHAHAAARNACAAAEDRAVQEGRSSDRHAWLSRVDERGMWVRCIVYDARQSDDRETHRECPSEA